MKVKDQTDPLNVNPSNSFKNLLIDNSKDIEMSDQGATDHNGNSTLKNKAEAMVEPVTKANLGSNTSHLASPLKSIKTLLLMSIRMIRRRRDRTLSQKDMRRLRR